MIMTPDDPMSGGLDVQQAETPEARTLLQLIQGIDVCRHLPEDILGVLMGVPMSRGLKLTGIHVLEVRPFLATLTATVPPRDGEKSVDRNASTPGAGAAGVGIGTATVGGQAATPAVDAVKGTMDGGVSIPEAVLMGEQSAGSSGVVDSNDSPFTATPVESGKALQKGEGDDAVTATTTATDADSLPQGRPRVAVIKEAQTKVEFEAVALALRYPEAALYVRSELLWPMQDGKGGTHSFEL
ncbi:unnamed protein product, partial [Choristocarpus tenellus]